MKKNFTRMFYVPPYCRLKMSYGEGSFSYSKIISLTNGNGIPAIVCPNPSIESITLSVPPVLIQSASTMNNVSGRFFKSISITANDQQVSVKSLNGGVYILKFIDGVR